MQKSQSNPIYIDREELAKLIGCTVQTVDNYRKDGIFTAYKIGNLVRFKYDEVIAKIDDLRDRVE